MADDAGDAIAQETQQTISQVINMLIYRAGMGRMGKRAEIGHGPGLDIASRLGEAFGERRNEGEQDDDPDADVSDEEGEAKYEAEPGLDPDPSFVEVAVDNEEDFEFIKGVLDRNNVEYRVSHEYAEDATWSLASRSYSEGAQIAIFELPDRDIEPKVTVHVPFSTTEHVLIPSSHPYTQLKDLDPEVMSLFGFFTREALDAKLELRRVARDIGFEGILDELPAFEPGKQGNLSLDFTTVKWDPDALIMSDPLDRMGVPYEKHMGDGIARFEFSREAAPAIKAVADWHLNHAESKIAPSRFPDYGRLEEAVKNQGMRSELIEVSVKDQKAATLLKEELKERGVAFEAIRSKATGEETFLARADEIRAKAPELEALRHDCESGELTARASALTGRKNRQVEANEQAAGRAKTTKVKPLSESKVSAYRTPTPTRDQAQARKSVQARRTSHNKTIKKTAMRSR